MGKFNITLVQAGEVVALWMKSPPDAGLVLGPNGRFKVIADHLSEVNPALHSNIRFCRDAYTITTELEGDSVHRYLGALHTIIGNMQKPVCAVLPLGYEPDAFVSFPEPQGEGMALVDVETREQQSIYVRTIKDALGTYHCQLRDFFGREAGGVRPAQPFGSLTALAGEKGKTPVGSRLFFDRVFVPILRSFQQVAVQWPHLTSGKDKHIVASRFILSQLIQVYVRLLEAEVPSGGLYTAIKQSKKESAEAMSVEFNGDQSVDSSFFRSRNFGRQTILTSEQQRARNGWGYNTFRSAEQRVDCGNTQYLSLGVEAAHV